MLRNLIVLPDGTEIFSGVGTTNALESVTITQRVNAGRELTLGSVCANMVEAVILTPAGRLEIPAGTELALYKVDDTGVRTKVGLFTTEEPVRPSPNRYKITAYDRVSWLDRNLQDWASGLDGWPYGLYDLAKAVCAACNLTLRNRFLPNTDCVVRKLPAGNLTGRQLMRWIGELCGLFCRATADGEIEFAWYTPRDVMISPEGEHPIHALSFEDYQVSPIDRVVVRSGVSDTGFAWGSGSNAYVITGNRLIMPGDNVAPELTAYLLHQALQGVAYTPGRVTIPATTEIQAGDILRVTDKNGKSFPFYVMTKVQSGQLDMLECTGSIRRDSPTVVSNAQLAQLQMGVDGLELEHQNTEGKMAELEVSFDGLRVAVTDQRKDVDLALGKITTLEQTAQGLSVQVQSFSEEGATGVSTATGYTFDENGITVEKSGREIKTQITEDGMTVYKNRKAVLTANSKGVDAVDLQASTYLIVGERSRFENYGSNRTACFWIGG